MRPIKFRGKAKNGEWIYGDLLHSFQAKPPTSITEIVTIDQTNGWADGSEVHPDTVGQFTGLKDIHGVEIYEGDIVSKCVRKGRKRVGDKVVNDLHRRGVGVVEWNEARNGFHFRSATPQRLVCRNEENTTMLKVLGNIHDNPSPITEIPYDSPKLPFE